MNHLDEGDQKRLKQHLDANLRGLSTGIGSRPLKDVEDTSTVLVVDDRPESKYHAIATDGTPACRTTTKYEYVRYDRDEARESFDCCDYCRIAFDDLDDRINLTGGDCS